MKSGPYQWWLVVSLSGLLFGWSWHSGWAAMIWSGDQTYIASGIVLLYALFTAWVGGRLLRGEEPPFDWMDYLAAEMPLWGLIGTVVGFVLAFGLDSGGTLDDHAKKAAAGTALFTTLTGAVCSTFIFLQSKMLR